MKNGIVTHNFKWWWNTILLHVKNGFVTHSDDFWHSMLRFWFVIYKSKSANNIHTPWISERTRHLEDCDGHTFTWLVRMWQDSMKCDSTYMNMQLHFLLVHSFGLVLNFHTAKMSERTCWYEDHDGHIFTWPVAMWHDLLMCDSTCLSLSQPKVQCVAVWCSVLQCVAVCSLICNSTDLSLSEPKVQCVAVCCSLLQCVAVCCRVLQCVAVCCSVLQCVSVCTLICDSTDLSLSEPKVQVLRSVLQCVAVC